MRLLLDDAERAERPHGWSGENIRAYLSNDEFLMLAKQGFIGTRGTTTEALKKVVTAAWKGSRGVVVAADHTDASTAERVDHG